MLLLMGKLSGRVTHLGHSVSEGPEPTAFGVKSGDDSTVSVADRHHRGNVMEWIVRLECRDKGRVLP
jgi:hypothetical protein